MILFASVPDAPDTDADAGDQQPDDAAGGDQGAEQEGRFGKLKRRAGCLWRAITEPVVILGVMILVLIFGRGYLRRRARRIREQQEDSDNDSEGDSADDEQ